MKRNVSTPSAKDFGHRLASARKAARLTQKELGTRCGVNPTQLSHYECGLAVPSMAILLRMAVRLDVTVDSLVGCTRIRLPRTKPEKAPPEIRAPDPPPGPLDRLVLPDFKSFDGGKKSPGKRIFLDPGKKMV